MPNDVSIVGAFDDIEGRVLPLELIPATPIINTLKIIITETICS